MALWQFLPAILGAPAIASVVTAFVPSRGGRFVTIASAVTILVSVFALDYSAISSGVLGKIVVVGDGYFVLDPLALWMLSVLSIVYTFISIYLAPFTSKEIEEGMLDERRARLLHSLANVFILTMLLSVVSNNIFLLWASVEATTLASAFLVSLYGKATSLEAGWKYVVICSVGLVFSLFGTALLYSFASRVIGAKALLWSQLVSHRGALAAGLGTSLALSALIIGYGTKAGLVPMWTWLPDAHAEAPAPISAMLSGILIKCAFLGVVRYSMIALSLGLREVQYLVLFMGLASMWLAAFFIVTSRDLKRLLAFHSVENIGISATGIGFATSLAAMGGLYHLMTHGLVKAMLFLLSGAALWIYGTRDMRLMGRLLRINRALAAVIVAGGLALGCSPPFAMFLSSFLVAYGGLEGGYLPLVILYAAASAIVFAGIVTHVIHIAVGEPRKEVENPGRSRVPVACVAVLIAMLILITLLGVYIPHPLREILSYASKEFIGVAR